MENWYKIVRHMKDDSDESYLIQQCVYRIFNDLRRSKLRDKTEKEKLKNRTGRVFEQWIAKLAEDYSSDFISDILQDDEFWEETIKLTLNM